jgi:hypothetical protein
MDLLRTVAFGPHNHARVYGGFNGVPNAAWTDGGPATGGGLDAWYDVWAPPIAYMPAGGSRATSGAYVVNRTDCAIVQARGLLPPLPCDAWHYVLFSPTQDATDAGTLDGVTASSFHVPCVRPSSLLRPWDPPSPGCGCALSRPVRMGRREPRARASPSPDESTRQNARARASPPPPTVDATRAPRAYASPSH